jgi:ribulose-5-phosphate 4-epimerase/fuculose-1-phosphate aldolase
MGHEFSAGASAVTLGNVDRDALREARIDLAASLRMAARLGLEEGTCNHFSAMVPGRDDLFLVNPYGLMFREVTASSILVCDFEGNVVDGEGQPEATAFFIHARLHKKLPRARAAFHTHMPYSTALSMVEGDPLIWAGQTSLKFYGRVAVDEAYNGLALDEAEGDRIAAAMGDADLVFMRNHGVMVTAPTIAMAWDDLYYLAAPGGGEAAADAGRAGVRHLTETLRQVAALIPMADAERDRLAR